MPQKQEAPSVIRKKVLLLGDSGTGKTHLLRAHNGSTTMMAHVPTVLQTTVVPVKAAEDGRKVELALWEVGGSGSDENFLKVAAAGAHVAAICYAADDPRSLQNSVRKWANQLHTINPELPLFLVGCKADLKPTKAGKYRKGRHGHKHHHKKESRFTQSSEDSGIYQDCEEVNYNNNASSSSTFLSSKRGLCAASIIDAEFKECSAESPASVRSVFRRIANMVL